MGTASPSKNNTHNNYNTTVHNKQVAAVDWWPEAASLLPLVNWVENIDHRQVWVCAQV